MPKSSCERDETRQVEQETQKHGTRIESFKADLGRTVDTKKLADFCARAKPLRSMEGYFRADKESSDYGGGHAGHGVDHSSAKGIRSG